MFQRWIDDFRSETAIVMRLSVLAIVTGAALAITTAFLCAALLVLVYQHFGAIYACLAGAALFFVVTLVSALCYWLIQRKRRNEAIENAKAAAKSTARTLLNDPAALAIALQVTRMIGVKRLLPLLAVGGVALGLFAGNRERAKAPDPADTP